MKNGWYKVIASVPNSKTHEWENVPLTLLSVHDVWYKDFDRHNNNNKPFTYPVLSVGTSYPIMDTNLPINCGYENLMDLVSEIFVQAIEDYQEQLVNWHFHKAKEFAAEIRLSEKILDGLYVHGQDVIKASREHSNYLIFRREHVCWKCREKKCPHRTTDKHPRGNYKKFGKVGCLKDESGNTGF